MEPVPRSVAYPLAAPAPATSWQQQHHVGSGTHGKRQFNAVVCRNIQDSVSGGNKPVALTVAGNLILSGNNSYTGGTTINPGATLQLGNGGTTGSIDLTTVNNSGTLAFNRSDPINLTTVINGGTLQQLGSGTLTLLGR